MEEGGCFGGLGDACDVVFYGVAAVDVAWM
jgi:hypothetical protein